MRKVAAALLFAAAFLPGVRADDKTDDLPVGTNPGAIASTRQEVSAKTKLVVGQVLQVQWGNQWWAAKVVAVRDDGSVKITYVGWAKSWDEWVKRDRLQLDKDAVKKARAGKPVPIPWPPRPIPAMWPRPLPQAPAPPPTTKAKAGENVEPRSGSLQRRQGSR